MACLTTAFALLAFGATPAVAQPSLTLSTGPDPAESIVTQVIASGASPSNDTVLEVTVKATGGQACATNSSADDGTAVIDGQIVQEVSFSNSVNHEFQTAGSYLLCGWLNDNSQPGHPIVATASLTVAVRPPHLALSISAPATVAVGQTFQVVTTAQAEVSRAFAEEIVPNTGRGCAANETASLASAGVIAVGWPTRSTIWAVNGGPFSESANEILRSAGQYLICAYVEYPNSASPPELTSSAAITAVAPPPPCVVPAFTSLSSLATVTRSIRAGSCAVGAIRRVASRKVRSGYVIALSHPSGRQLPSGTAIAITVSTGPPCVVPLVSAGSALGTVERRLAANHCSTGKISSTRSRRYRRGRVLRLGARTGQTLASHAAVPIVIAAGHRRGH